MRFNCSGSSLSGPIAATQPEAADSLTEERKRDILYNNAARFPRLTDEEIVSHYDQ